MVKSSDSNLSELLYKGMLQQERYIPAFLHVLKVNLDILSMGGIDLPQGAATKIEQPGNEQVGELFDADIVDRHAVVVVLPAVSDHVL